MTTTTRTQGTVLTWNGQAIGEVTNISGLSAPSTKINITSFADTVMKYRPGRRKAGTFTFGVNFNPDNTVQAAILADRQSDTERTVTLVTPEGTIDTITFTARVMNFTLNGQNSDVWKGEVTLKITSVPVRS